MTTSPYPKNSLDDLRWRGCKALTIPVGSSSMGPGGCHLCDNKVCLAMKYATSGRKAAKKRGPRRGKGFPKPKRIGRDGIVHTWVDLFSDVSLKQYSLVSPIEEIGWSFMDVVARLPSRGQTAIYHEEHDFGSFAPDFYAGNGVWQAFAHVDHLRLAMLTSLNTDVERMREFMTPASDNRIRALKTMTPSLTTGISLVNFLIELKDFREILRPLKRRVTNPLSEDVGLLRWANIEELDRALLRFGKSLKTAPLSTISDLASGGILTLKFAIEPFIRDIQKICTQLASFQARSSAFIAAANRLETRRRFRAVDESTDQWLSDLTPMPAEFSVLLPDVSAGERGPDLDLRFRYGAAPRLEAQTGGGSGSVSGVIQNTFVMDFNYSVETLMDINVTFAAFLQTLGVRPDASILWNAIPFSFLIDWIYDVSSFLEDNVSTDVISAHMTIHTWLESVRARVTWDAQCDAFSIVTPGDGVIHFPVHTAESLLRSEYYNRAWTSPPAENLKPSVDPGIRYDRTLTSAALFRKLAGSYR